MLNLAFNTMHCELSREFKVFKVPNTWVKMAAIIISNNRSIFKNSLQDKKLKL